MVHPLIFPIFLMEAPPCTSDPFFLTNLRHAFMTY